MTGPSFHQYLYIQSTTERSGSPPPIDFHSSAEAKRNIQVHNCAITFRPPLAQMIGFEPHQLHNNIDLWLRPASCVPSFGITSPVSRCVLKAFGRIATDLIGILAARGQPTSASLGVRYQRRCEATFTCRRMLSQKLSPWTCKLPGFNRGCLKQLYSHPLQSQNSYLLLMGTPLVQIIFGSQSRPTSSW